MSHPTSLHRLETRAHHWFFQTRSVAPLAFARVFLGSILFLSALQFVGHIEWIYGEDGLLRHIFSNYAAHPFRRFAAPTILLLAGSSLAFSLGVCTRLSGLTAAACQAFIASAGLWHSWGWTNLIPVFVVIVALSNAGNAWSVDAWWAHRRGTPRSAVGPAWSLRLLQVHVVVVYIAASWHRIDDPGWIQGEMVFAAVANSMYSRLPYLDPTPLKSVFQVLTWATEALEILGPVLLLFRRTRVPVVLALIALHVGLEVSAIIGWWQYMMIVMLFTFLPATWSARVLDTLRLPVSGTAELHAHA